MVSCFQYIQDVSFFDGGGEGFDAIIPSHKISMVFDLFPLRDIVAFLSHF